MKTTLFPLLLICFISLASISCEKDSLFLNPDKKLEGIWKYEKVEFCKTFSFSRKNRTSDFKHITLEFKSNNDFTQNSPVPSENGNGRWEIKTFYETEPIDEVSHYLKGYINNKSSNQTKDIEWYDFQVGRKKLSFTERKDGGIYRYQLRKQ